MKQFDVCPNPSPRSRAYAPYVVVLQSHLIAAMPTTIVAPLLIADDRKAYTDVSATVTFEGSAYFVSAAELVAIETKALKAIGSLRDFEFEIRHALERVFTGF